MRPRVWLAAILVALLQTGVIAFIIVNRAVHLAHGREIVLDVIPVGSEGPAARRLCALELSRFPAQWLHCAFAGTPRKRHAHFRYS